MLIKLVACIAFSLAKRRILLISIQVRCIWSKTCLLLHGWFGHVFFIWHSGYTSETKHRFCFTIQKICCGGWHSNSPFVDELSETPQAEVLGHCWNKTNHDFGPNFDVSLPELVNERSISSAATLWDPVKIFALLTLNLRILPQKLWRLRIPWDEMPPNSITQRFKQILGQIFALQDFRISR